MSLLQPPRLPEIASSDRIRARALVIAVVDTLPGQPIAAHLAGAFASRVVRARILVRHKAGFDLQSGGAASHPDALLPATRALLAALAPHDVLIAEGPALLAALDVRLAILGTPTASLVALDPDVRAQRPRFDLVVHDFRPRTLDLIAQSLGQHTSA